MNAARLAAALSERAEAVCRQYLPHGRRQGRYWVAGDLDGARGRSLYVRLGPRHAGEVDRRGDRRARRPPRPRAPSLARADASRGARRGPRLPRPAGCAGRGRGLGRFLRRHRGRAPSLGAVPRHRRHPRGALSPRAGARALPLLLLALPLRASLSRRLVRPAAPGAGRRRDRRRRRRHRRAAHLARPPLARQGGRRIASQGARAHLRPRRALRRPADGASLLVGEGIETVLSLITAVPEVTAAAALTAGSLGAFAPPPGVARLVIARDNDAEGERAAERLARRCARARVAALVLVPEGGDFNDDLVALGPHALAARWGRGSSGERARGAGPWASSQ